MTNESSAAFSPHFPKPNYFVEQGIRGIGFSCGRISQDFHWPTFRCDAAAACALLISFWLRQIVFSCLRLPGPRPGVLPSIFYSPLSVSTLWHCDLFRGQVYIAPFVCSLCPVPLICIYSRAVITGQVPNYISPDFQLQFLTLTRPEILTKSRWQMGIACGRH